MPDTNSHPHIPSRTQNVHSKAHNAMELNFNGKERTMKGKSGTLHATSCAFVQLTGFCLKSSEMYLKVKWLRNLKFHSSTIDFRKVSVRSKASLNFHWQFPFRYETLSS